MSGAGREAGLTRMRDKEASGGDGNILYHDRGGYTSIEMCQNLSI